MRNRNKTFLSSIKTLLFGSVLFFYSPLIFSQGQGDILYSSHSWEIGPYIGVSNFHGDLARSMKLENTGYSFGGTLKYNFNHFTALRANFNSIKIWGKDSRVNLPLNQYRQESFSAGITEFGGLVDYNFIPFSHPKQLMNWSPYLVGGLSIFYISTNNNAGTSEDIKPVNVAIPFGGGSRIQLNPQWIINFEFIARKTFTDALDFPESEFPNGSQRSITTNKDWFYTFQTGVSYTFFGVKCPPHERQMGE